MRDEFEKWQDKQANEETPFCYIYPQMPPRFRFCCRWLKGLLWLERGCMTLFMFMVMAVCILTLAEYEIPCEFSFIIIIFMTLLVWWGCRLLRHTPKFFWHCPHCGKPFPYYAPPIRGSDTLKEPDCIYEMDYLHISYIKLKFCPLIVPSVCPECKAKFFEYKASETIK